MLVAVTPGGPSTDLFRQVRLQTRQPDLWISDPAGIPEGAAVVWLENGFWYPTTYLGSMEARLQRFAAVRASDHTVYDLRTRLAVRSAGAPCGFGAAREGLDAVRRFGDGFTGTLPAAQVAENDAFRPIRLLSGDDPPLEGGTPDPDGALLRQWLGEPVTDYLSDSGTVYLFSNVEGTRLDVRPEDILVFLNTATPLDLYEGHPHRIIYHRTPRLDSGEERLCVRNRYVFDAGLLGVPPEFIRLQYARYAWDYEVPEGCVRAPTTGYLVAQYLRERYPTRETVLVNFGLTVKRSTGRWPGHNWVFEDRALQGFRHVFTCDVVR